MLKVYFELQQTQKSLCCRSLWRKIQEERVRYNTVARTKTDRVGRILIGRGRDAVDVPISNTFGPNTLAGFTVVTDEILQSVPA
jgi:hypothetical protein